MRPAIRDEIASKWSHCGYADDVADGACQIQRMAPWGIWETVNPNLAEVSQVCWQRIAENPDLEFVEMKSGDFRMVNVATLELVAVG